MSGSISASIRAETGSLRLADTDPSPHPSAASAVDSLPRLRGRGLGWGLDRAADRAIAQQVVGQDASHHGLADRHGADTDAGIVPAVGFDLDLVQIGVDRAHWFRDRAGRLDRE